VVMTVTPNYSHYQLKMTGRKLILSRTAAPLLLLLAAAIIVFLLSHRDVETNLETAAAPQWDTIRPSLDLRTAASPSQLDVTHASAASLLQSQDIWYSRWMNNEIYANLKEKELNERSIRAELLDRQNFQPLSVCGRTTNVGTTQDLTLLEKYFKMDNTCPGENSKKIMVLRGDLAHGRIGNNLIEFLHALQFARDMDYQLAITSNSWAIEMLRMMWFNPSYDDGWAAKFEKEFCVKIIQPDDSLKGWVVVPYGLNPNNSVAVTKYLFDYQSELPLDKYIASQSRFIQKLFRHYNLGPESMCSGINAIFGDEKKDVMYSVIHNRHLEGAPGLRLMQRMSRTSRCHPTAALEMYPEYVKSILRPIGMLNHPIVLITDGENPDVAKRLLEDPEIGPMLRLVPESASWIGGDITLGIMSNVFIGNPASSFSGFIAKARIAFGFGHNHLFRTKVSTGIGKLEWVTSCGDACVFDKNMLGNMS